MNLQDLSRMNRKRSESPDGFDHPLEGWSLSDWLVAAMGELGEAANIVKKLNRDRDGIAGNEKTEEELRSDLADEIGDTLAYLDLFTQAAGFDLETVFLAKFDRVSAKMSYPAQSMEEFRRRFVFAVKEYALIHFGRTQFSSGGSIAEYAKGAAEQWWHDTRAGEMFDGSTPEECATHDVELWEV